jgi:uncharacterized membrane protein
MPQQPPLPARLDTVDALRGFALVWMAIYHFCFDLNNFGYVRLDFYNDPVWTWQRTAILSLFLLCAGSGQALAVHNGQAWQRFWQRWSWVAVCAVLVSAGSWFMFPRSFIYFGVLHGMAVMLIVARLTAHWRAWSLVPATLAFALPWLVAPWLSVSPMAETFNAPALNWLGLITRRPITEDYVPLLPWIGVVWVGVAAASIRMRRGASGAAWRASSVVGGGLARLGRHSLLFYMLHQPVLIAALWVFKTVSG